MGDYTPAQRRNLDAVETLFDPPPGFDVASLFAPDAVWWNGLTRLPGLEGRSNHDIGGIRQILGSAGARRADSPSDSYDLSTKSYEDVVVLVDGDWVVRQHTMRAKTHAGRDYVNVYCFVFRFDAQGRIAHLTEHTNTWWIERFLLDYRAPEPSHPLPK
jgi:ketosteroid isomerase-like protein